MIDRNSPPAAAARTARRKRPEDTPEGCRAFAAADLDRAAGLTGEHGRWRFEHSAAAWTTRADLLARIEASFQARSREARA
ncbi:MAG TPA: hypothetical protein VN231_04420 [Allosphingosinicella sp.]|nr:hypothetical protein [Allosphingosinicella sp.]